MPDKTSVSKAQTYEDIGAFWDDHDATEFGEQFDMEFEIDVQNQIRYYPIDNNYTSRLKQLAKEEGISEIAFVNLWIQEKINQANIDKKPKEAV
jgi:hypothetical protein